MYFVNPGCRAVYVLTELTQYQVKTKLTQSRDRCIWLFFLSRSRKIWLFICFFSCSQWPQTFDFNMTCDWPTNAATKTHAVSGVVKLNLVYLTELPVQWRHFRQLNASIHVMVSDNAQPWLLGWEPLHWETTLILGIVLYMYVKGVLAFQRDLIPFQMQK